MKQILVSCPPISDDFGYYCYIDCIIRTSLKEYDCAFHPSIFYRFTHKNISQFDDTLRQTDILMLSCYVWNWELQLALADRAREINPDIIVVGGGPQVHKPYYDRFDHVVMGEAEHGVRQILDGTAGHIVHSIRKTDFEISPYIDNRDMLLAQREQAKARKMALGVIFEANRGCPFACAYCDWGSATQSKVHYFQQDRTFDEIDFVCNVLQPSFWFHADANFGITDRDIDISHHLVKAKQRTSFPKAFYYSTSKNTWKRNVEIAKILHQGGLIDTYNIGIQHTHKDVLEASVRGNIKPDQFRIIGSECQKNGIPTNTQMILGMPGDTRAKWFQSLCETFEWGFHSETKVYWYNLLPNAPAAHPDYVKEWQIETKPVIYNQARLLKDHDEVIDKAADIIVSCKTFDREDWINMNIDTKWLQALHNMALLRHTAMYWRFTHDVPYETFYRDVIDNIGELGEKFNEQYEQYLRQLLAAGNRTDYIPFLFNGELVKTEVEDVLILYLLEHKDEFYEIVNKKWGHEDLIDYQKSLVLDMDYDPDIGRTMSLKHDWVRYFKDKIYTDPPHLNRDIVYKTNQSEIKGPTDFTSSRMLWHKTNNQRRKLSLFQKAALGQLDWRGEQRMVLKEWKNV